VTVPTVGPRVLRRALLVDRIAGEPVDLVDVGLLHLAQELARTRSGSDVPPLPLGVDGVERGLLLPLPDNPVIDEAITREGDVDVLEVVLARSAHDDPIPGHAPSLPDQRETEQVFDEIGPGRETALGRRS
jgi:hypothetical protein